MRHRLFLIGFCIAFAVFAENPLEFREYQQEVILTFSSEAEANQADLQPNGLPKDYKLALSARWDDASPAHLTTQELMRKHGIAGTFFLNFYADTLRTYPYYLQKLQQQGCSIGLHTVNHPQLPLENAFTHFYEYMANRISLETAGQCMINAQVLPFCAWIDPAEEITSSIGWAMRATGVISAPDVFFPHKNWHLLGYPENSIAHSRLLTPGDKVPDRGLFEKQLAGLLNDTAALAQHPSISMSMHSWHSPEGLVVLDGIFETLSNHPDWWYCNQTEYGAYRYEALNTKISRKVQGKQVHFTISRVFPSELGANLPLWFTVKNAVPLATTAGMLQDNLLELPHDKGYQTPIHFDVTNKDGKSRLLSEITMRLEHQGQTWTARIQNNGHAPIEQLALTFRFPSSCAKETLRKDVAILEAGESIDVQVEQPVSDKGLYFRYGVPYYAVQMDFMRNQVLCRLYATLQETEAEGLPATINQVAVIYKKSPEIDLAKLSTPGIDPATLNLTPQGRKPVAKKIAPNVVFPNLDTKQWKDRPNYLAVVEFRPLKPGKYPVTSMLCDSTPWRELWLNGNKISSDKPRLYTTEVTLVEGVNRLVLSVPYYQMISLRFGDGKAQVVEFLPPSFQH